MVSQFHSDKFNALVHYICGTCTDLSKLNATKLNKILWLSDMLAYSNHGSPITGETYKKDKYGPVPVHINAALEQLKREKKMQVRDVPYSADRKRREFVAEGRANTSLFSKEEIELVDFVRNYICEDHTADSISALTHDDLWKMAQMGERIPYEAILAFDFIPASKNDIEWARSILTEQK